MIYYTLDNGNSHPHLGLFDNQRCLDIVDLKTGYLSIKNNKPILLSTVNERPEIINRLNNPIVSFRSLRKKDSFLNMPVYYSETLGEDRLYQAYYIFNKYIKDFENILLVDSGTFLTADLITKDGFIGGHIFPGIQTLCQSYSKGAFLPEFIIDSNEDFSEIGLGNDTQSAIKNAVNMLVNALFEGITKDLKNNSLVLFTGGQTQQFFKGPHILSKHKSIHYPHLIHHSLSYIYKVVIKRKIEIENFNWN